MPYKKGDYVKLVEEPPTFGFVDKVSDIPDQRYKILVDFGLDMGLQWVSESMIQHQE